MIICFTFYVETGVYRSCQKISPITLIMRKFAKTISIAYRFSDKKIPRPRDPTVAESFETKLSEEQMKILMDPKGFMT